MYEEELECSCVNSATANPDAAGQVAAGQGGGADRAGGGSAALSGDCRGDQARLKRPGALPTGADRPGWAALRNVQAPHDANRRRKHVAAASAPEPRRTVHDQDTE